MKKITLTFLGVIFILNAAIGLVGCKDKHEHSFTEQATASKYLVMEAICTEAAKYYYSCACGEKGTKTFTFGNALGHSFTNYISDGNATCMHDGTKTAECNRNGCNETDTVADIGSAKGHFYSEKWATSENEHWHIATCGHDVESGRAKHTFDENKKCTVCDYVTVKPFGLELQSSVFNVDFFAKTAYLKVANAVTDYDFSDKYTVADGARFDVCTDKQCNNKISSKKTDIIVGDNVFYILVTNGNDVASYTVTLRRRPIYTVTFNTNGGSAVEPQYVEEDNFATEPTTSKKGYDFVAWDYDFLSPVLSDITINAILHVKEEMQNYEFTSTADICEITGVKNTKITQAIIPDYVTSIGFSAFKGCSSITSITVPFVGAALNETMNTHFGYIFGASWYMVNSNYVPSNLKSVEISSKSGVTSIDDYAFAYCGGLTSVTIPDSVASIGFSAFSDCGGLTSVTIPDSVTSIDDFAFNACVSLIRIIVSSGNKRYHSSGNCLIKTDAKTLILGCKNSIIPSDGSVTSIGKGAFCNCRRLISIAIPNVITSIDSAVFCGCSGLTSITIPYSVTSIGNWAFSACSSLTSIIVSSGNTKYHSSGNCLIETETKTLILGCKNSIIPSDGSVTSIGEYAFEGCSGLTSIIIPDGVTSIDDYAFAYCGGLTSVTIPNSVISIGFYVFENCSGLTTINYNGTKAKWSAISKHSSWDYNAGDYKVVCTNGMIKKQ